jgi:hypothetical protein
MLGNLLVPTCTVACYADRRGERAKLMVQAMALGVLLASPPVSPSPLPRCERVTQGDSFEVRGPTVIYVLPRPDLHGMTREALREGIAREDARRELTHQRRRLSAALVERGLAVRECPAGIRFRTRGSGGVAESVVLGGYDSFAGTVLVAPGKGALTNQGVETDATFLRRLDDYFR